MSQKRQWQVNGEPLSADPLLPDAGEWEGRIAHRTINEAYPTMLEAIGLPKWILAFPSRTRRGGL